MGSIAGSLHEAGKKLVHKEEGSTFMSNNSLLSGSALLGMQTRDTLRQSGVLPPVGSIAAIGGPNTSKSKSKGWI
jgi:hypothetical protein